MDLSLSESQLTYLDTVRKFVKNEITPHILELEKVIFSPGTSLTEPGKPAFLIYVFRNLCRVMKLMQSRQP